MAYSEKTKQLIADAPPSLGTNLAQWAVQRGVSVQQVATATGATRQTVYNWFTGTTLVTPAYQEKVLIILGLWRRPLFTMSLLSTKISCTSKALKRGMG